MATTTKTTKATIKADSVPFDARRTPLASPTTEPRSNPLDAAVPPKSGPSASSSAATLVPPKSSPESAKVAGSAKASAKAPAVEPDTEEQEPESDVIIEMETFQQILDLEEDEGSYDFSLGMAQAYLNQAKDTFKDMDKALGAKDLKKLGELGHFLKGSSAALGVHKVHHSCERMQNYGKGKDAKGEKTISEDVALARITVLLSRVKREFEEAELYLIKWYSDRGVDL